MSTKYQFKREPLAHQKTCLDKSWNKKAFAFFIDMGGGKSKITIDTAGILFHTGKIHRWLCIAPNGIYTNWKNEIEIDLGAPYNLMIWKKDIMSSVKPELQILLMNIEALSTKKGLDYARKFVDDKTLITIDESTTIKSHKAKRSISVVELGRKAGYRRILSGYPSPQNQLDLFMQFNFLDQDIFGVKSYYAFRNQYAEVYMVNNGPGRPQFPKIIGPKNTEMLKAKMDPFSFRIRKDECLDLPPKVYTTRSVEMSEDQRRLYSEMQKSAVAILETEDIVTAPIVLTQLVRLHQISCGFAKDTEGKVHRIGKNPKIEALKEVLGQTSGKVIVWCNYVENIREIEDEFRNSDYGELVTYYGGTSASDRERAIESFQQGGARIFVGNPSTAGFGLTLTAAEVVVYFSNSYNLEHRLQSEDRAHRIGQQKSVLYVDLMTPGTVDEKIIKALVAKKQIGNQILGDEWKEWIL